MKQFKKSLVWFRRDLRFTDHHALHAALTQSEQVHCVFIFDRDILDALPHPADRRVEFIWEAIQSLQQRLQGFGSDLIIRHASAEHFIPELARDLAVDAVFANRDYEPAAVERDAKVLAALASENRQFLSFKDQVIFEQSEVLTALQKPYSVFTPYKNAWLKSLNATSFQEYATEKYASHLAQIAPSQRCALPSLEAMGFERTNLKTLSIPLGEAGANQLVDDFLPRMAKYGETRDFPAIKGPSYLSVHNRFGTLSIRAIARLSLELWQSQPEIADGARVWLAELIWRDFYFQILHHHPRVVDGAFKAEYNDIVWDNDPQLFKAWCDGKTGYPLIDAAMLQLNQTGYMHNRLRMVVASFLTKDLGIDWRWGEKYFAEQLNDFDLSANNGGWQWAASSGCDAQPYFRIFNPLSQSEKFDTQGQFIKRYLPQLSRLSKKTIHAPWLAGPIELADAGLKLGSGLFSENSYPLPIVNHDTARKKTLMRYSVVKKQNED